MKKTVVTFGLISGAIVSLLMAVSVPFADQIGFDRALVVGYTTIVLSLLLVPFGIRSYRENVGNGQIAFGRAFAVGICITLISCVCYVVTWEVIYYNFLPDHLDKYAAYLIAKAKASGASAQALQAKLQELQKMKELYANPLINGLMTFIEPFPVGLVITLISAAILRTKRRRQPAESVATA